MPLRDWFRGPLRLRVREALTSQEFSDARIFDGAALEQLLSQHEQGKRDHSPVLWLLLMFGTFLKTPRRGHRSNGELLRAVLAGMPIRLLNYFFAALTPTLNSATHDASDRTIHR